MTPLRKEMIAVRHRAALLSTGLAVAAAVLVLPAPANAAADGVAVRITRLPDTFTAGAGPAAVQAVASTNSGRCQKVRWSMLLTVQGGGLNEVRVERIEQNSAFPVQVRADGNSARLTDVRFDPGTLCPGRTVTATYGVAFDGAAPPGQVTFEADALDSATRVLQSASATSRIAGPAGAQPSAPATAEPAPSETGDGAGDQAGEPPSAAADPPSGAAAAPPPSAADLAAQRAARSSSIPSLLGPGLIVGALLVFVGVGLLLRLKSRNRGRRRSRTEQYPPSYYPAP
jgi:hypothetical protein